MGAPRPLPRGSSFLKFVPYTAAAAPGEIGKVRAELQEDGTFVAFWTPGEGVFVDRLVRGDEYAPYNPDRAALVAVTDQGRALDGEPFSHAVRHYQVWRHVGTSLEDAQQRQPVLVATGVVVSPPRELRLQPDEGTVVTGGWNLPPGTDRVQVYRVPISQAFSAGMGNPQYRILPTERLLGGFADGEPSPGATYVYQMIAEAAVDGVVHTSPAITREVVLSQVHEPILDLQFTLHEGGEVAYFDLTWTDPPGGGLDLPDRGGSARRLLPAADLHLRPSRGKPASRGQAGAPPHRPRRRAGRGWRACRGPGTSPGSTSRRS